MAKKAYGTVVRIATSANGTYVTLTDIIDISLPSITKDSYEITNINTDLGIKKYNGALVDTGELSFTTLGYVDESQIDSSNMPHTFESLLSNDTTIYVQYSTPDDTTYFQASGIVINVADTFAIDDVIKKEITIKLTSNITQIN